MCKLVVFIFCITILSCSKSTYKSELDIVKKQSDNAFLKKWEGVYVTTGSNPCKSLIMLYVINNNLKYYAKYCTDISYENEISQEYESGECFALNNFIYLPRGIIFYKNNRDISLTSQFSRFSLVIKNNKQELISEYIDNSKKQFITSLTKIEELKREGPDMPPVNNLKKILSDAVESKY